MKTLKKTLCLVLAVVMVVGTLAMSVAAADYVDAAEIKNDVAVGVMSALDIIDGKEGNKFDPAGLVKRSEAAKMIAVALLGKTTANALPAAASYDDVAATDWFSRYVSYCVRQGIIDGKENNKFDPNGQVTGVQLAKMLLCALGYGKQGEYVGAGWDSNAVIDATTLGFYAGLTNFKSENPCTREQAAQIIYNALSNNGKVVYSKLLETYGAPGDKYINVTKAANQTITAVEYVPATATAAAYVKATAGAHSFPAEFASVGHVVDVYYNGTTVYYVDYKTESAAVTARLTAGSYTNYNAAVDTYSNYLATGTATAVAVGDTVVYTTNANGTKTIVAIQRDAWTDGVATDNYVAAAGTTAAYNYTVLDSKVVASGNTTAQAITGYTNGGAELKKAVANNPLTVDVNEAVATTNVYYRAVGTQTVPYYEVKNVNYASGVVTVYNSTTGKLTVGGTAYTVAFPITIGTNVKLGSTYSFRLNAAGALVAIETAPASTTDYTGYKLGYVAGYYSESVYSFNPATGLVVPTTTKYANIGFIDGTYGTYTVAKWNGASVVSAAEYAALAVKTGYVDNNALTATGYVMVKVDGTAVDVIDTLNAEAYKTAANVTGAAASTIARTTTYYAPGTYVANDTVFAYVANANALATARTGAFKMTFVTGAHAFNGGSASVDGTYNGSYVAKYTTAANTTIAMFVIDAPYYVSNSVAGTDYYLVTSYVGQTANGYVYTAYQFGSNVATTITVSSPIANMNKFYTINATTTAGVTTYAAANETAMNGIAGNIAGLTTTNAAFVLNGKVYLTNNADYYAADNMVIVDLRNPAAAGYKPVTNAAEITEGLSVVAYTSATATGAAAYAVTVLYLVG